MDLEMEKQPWINGIKAVRFAVNVETIIKLHFRTERIDVIVGM